MGMAQGTEDQPAEQACERCGNTYDKTFAIVASDGGPARRFDCFECAIDTLAPLCAHCGLRVIGHGLAQGDRIFCCGSCARMEGVTFATSDLRGVTGPGQGTGTESSQTGSAPGDETYTRAPGV